MNSLISTVKNNWNRIKTLYNAMEFVNSKKAILEKGRKFLKGLDNAF